MSTMSPLPDNHPMLMAFRAYQKTDDYKNIRNWALHPDAVDGSLWAAFETGWSAQQVVQAGPGVNRHAKRGG